MPTKIFASLAAGFHVMARDLPVRSPVLEGLGCGLVEDQSRQTFTLAFTPHHNFDLDRLRSPSTEARREALDVLKSAREVAGVTSAPRQAIELWPEQRDRRLVA